MPLLFACSVSVVRRSHAYNIKFESTLNSNSHPVFEHRYHFYKFIVRICMCVCVSLSLSLTLFLCLWPSLLSVVRSTSISSYNRGHIYMAFHASMLTSFVHTAYTVERWVDIYYMRYGIHKYIHFIEKVYVNMVYLSVYCTPFDIQSAGFVELYSTTALHIAYYSE